MDETTYNNCVSKSGTIRRRKSDEVLKILKDEENTPNTESGKTSPTKLKDFFTQKIADSKVSEFSTVRE